MISVVDYKIKNGIINIISHKNSYKMIIRRISGVSDLSFEINDISRNMYIIKIYFDMMSDAGIFRFSRSKIISKYTYRMPETFWEKVLSFPRIFIIDHKNENYIDKNIVKNMNLKDIVSNLNMQNEYEDIKECFNEITTEIMR